MSTNPGSLCGVCAGFTLRKMADSLREEIRACVREELQKIERTPDQISNQSLVERTRSLIQSSATSASQALARNETLNQSSPLASVTSTPRFSSNKRPAPGHPLRYSGKKTKQKVSKTVTPQIIPKTVYLIDNINSQDESDYSLTESMILVKGVNVTLNQQIQKTKFVQNLQTFLKSSYLLSLRKISTLLDVKGTPLLPLLSRLSISGTLDTLNNYVDKENFMLD